MISVIGAIVVLLNGDMVVFGKQEQAYSSKDQVDYSSKSGKEVVETFPYKNPLDRPKSPVYLPLHPINPTPITNVNP